MKNIIRTLIIIHVLVVSILITAPALSAQPADNNEGVDWQGYDDGFLQSQQQGKPIMLEFYQNACLFCKEQNDTYLDSGVIKKSKEFVCIRVDVDAEIEIAEEYEVGFSPILYFLMPNGSEINIIYGVIEPFDLIANMTEALEYFDSNYKGQRFEQDPQDDNGNIQNGIERNESNSDIMLPVVVLIIVSIIAVIAIIKFVMVYKKNRSENNQEAMAKPDEFRFPPQQRY
ncbi:MAG: thioredoxin family protein [Thermoplasmata archaeon]|nr:MAG: thioredoxin family protein [Thermoplasmata archaeon]